MLTTLVIRDHGYSVRMTYSARDYSDSEALHEILSAVCTEHRYTVTFRRTTNAEAAKWSKASLDRNFFDREPMTIIDYSLWR